MALYIHIIRTVLLFVHWDAVPCFFFVFSPLACARCVCPQATTETAKQLAVAHAHGGAISLMTGDLAEAEGRFKSQLEEAQKEKNENLLLADTY